MANNQNNNASNEPWRAGRPSFKAFYPEIFLLTLITIAFVAIAVKLSCSTIRKAKGAASDKPAAVSLDAPLLAPLAFAQDASIDEAAPAPAADEPAPVAEDAAPAPADAPAPEQTNDEVTPVSDVPLPPATSEPAPDKKTKSESPWTKVVWIWVVCLIVPVILWVWRGVLWICAVWGVYYELRVDPDNPRATTFLTTHGILNKKTDSLHIGSIKDIQSHQTFFQKYFMGGVGTIILFTNDLTDGKVEMKNMPEPSRIFNALDSLRRNYWSRGGMQLHSGAETEPDADGGFNDELHNC